MKVLVTGSAGFIGFHVANRLLGRGDDVVGLDNVNTYYDPNLKEARLAHTQKIAERAEGDYQFVRADIADQSAVDRLFETNDFDRVIHLAAQAGVRHSIDNPRAFVSSNLVGFTNIIEACRTQSVPHLTYASTSSVYGANSLMPYAEHQGVDHPLQFYAATKRANELTAHSYSHLFNLPTTGLRFFTVYGPWGRPDMALFKFTRNILDGAPIEIFNGGHHTRDFTYIDDIVSAIVSASDRVAVSNPAWNSANPDPATSSAPFRILNVGNSTPVSLIEFVESLERQLGRQAIRKIMPRQLGDGLDSCADTTRLAECTGQSPEVALDDGMKRFIDWYLDYYSDVAGDRS